MHIYVCVRVSQAQRLSLLAVDCARYSSRAFLPTMGADRIWEMRLILATMLIPTALSGPQCKKLPHSYGADSLGCLSPPLSNSLRLRVIQYLIDIYATHKPARGDWSHYAIAHFWTPSGSTTPPVQQRALNFVYALADPTPGRCTAYYSDNTQQTMESFSLGCPSKVYLPSSLRLDTQGLFYNENLSWFT